MFGEKAQFDRKVLGMALRVSNLGFGLGLRFEDSSLPFRFRCRLMLVQIYILGFGIFVLGCRCPYHG